MIYSYYWMDNLTFRRRITMEILERQQQTFARRSSHSLLENADFRYDRMDHLVTPKKKLNVNCAIKKF